jgi:hypothetical protein
LSSDFGLDSSVPTSFNPTGHLLTLPGPRPHPTQIRWLLLVAGGYECQEAEGTFMVAFASADAALEWSLMAQRVLRDMDWPERWGVVAAECGVLHGRGLC